jgi:uncharacterized protein YjdB
MTLNGTNWEVNFDFTDGQFFTFATQVQVAPGGISSNLSMWLKADAGVTTGATLTWADQSGNGRNAIQATAANQPTLVSNVFNYNSALAFNGTSQYLAVQNLAGLPTGAGLVEAFAVANHLNTSYGWSHIFSYGSGASNQIFGIGKHSGTANATTMLHSFDAISAATEFAGGKAALIDGKYNGTQGIISTYGTQKATIAATGSKTVAGGYVGIDIIANSSTYWTGRIPEIILFSSNLTNAEVLRVNTYLALKYGITIDQTSAQNYVASDGSTIFWNATTNSTFKNNITGIARDDVSGLNQKQSQSVNTGLQVIIGNGNTIATTNTANTNNFSADRSALVWGDDAGAVSAWTASGAPSGVQMISRKWKVQETGSVGSVRVRIADNSGTNGLPAEVITVFLLVDADGDFTSGATQVSMTLSGTNWETNYDFTNGQFFTFGTLLLTTTPTNVLCFGNSTGGVNLFIAGSTQGYSFVWNNGSTAQNLTGVPSGNYVVTITDGVGVTATASATITQPGSAVGVTSSVTNVSFTGASNGAITITPSGGVPSYSYIWNTGSTTQNLSGLTAGNYTVTVTDANGCSKTSAITVGTTVNTSIVTKQLYLSEGMMLDRENPAAPPLDNTTSVTSTLSTTATGITVGNVTSTSTTTLTTITLAHTIAAGENRLLLVGVSNRSRTVVSVKYGTTDMLLEGNIANGPDANIAIYSLVNPSVGTANITVTLNGAPSTGCVVGGMNFTGVDTDDPLGNFTTATGSSASPSVTGATVSGNLLFNVLSVKNTTALTAGTSQTKRWDLASGEIRGGVSTRPATSATTTGNWTSGNAKWATGVIPIQQVVLTNSVTFTQNPSLCSALTIKAGNAISLSVYVNVISGTMPANPNITAVIRNGATNIITLTSPTYSSSTGILTWSGSRGTDITIAAGQAISLDVTTAQAGVNFQINHDSQNFPAKINLPVSTFINVNSHQLYNGIYPNGSVVTSVANTSTSSVRVTVSDPFGASDISGVNLTLTRPNSSSINVSLTDANVVSVAGCTKTYQYIWTNPTDIGTWSIQAVANEGTEGVTHSSSISISVTAPTSQSGQSKFLYLSDPSQALDRIDPVNTLDGTTSQTVTLSSTGTTSATFTQAPSLCGPVTMTSGGNVAVKAYASVITGSNAAVSVASTSSGSASSVAIGGTLSFAHTPGSGSNRLLLVSIAVGNTGVSDETAPGVITGVTFGGTAMTLVATAYSGLAVRSYIYRLINPTASPSANVVITLGTKASGVTASATTFNNVNQTTPLGTGQTYVANGTDYFISGTVTSADGELVYSTACFDEYIGINQGISSFTGQTELWNNSGWDFVSAATSTKPGAASVTVRYNSIDFEDGAMVAVSIKPAASSTLSANPNITAVLKYGTTTFATLSNPSFNSSTNLLTWSGTLGSNVSIPAGQAIALVITTAEPTATFRIDYDSQTKPSKIELPINESTQITTLAMYNAAYPGGSIITSATKGSTVYLRATVTNPFGTSDITGMTIFNAPLSLNDVATSVNTSGCVRTYQYVWTTPNSSGDFSITATAKEGYENLVTDSKIINFSLCPLILSPSITTVPTCNVPSGGYIKLNPSGGSGPYTWNWSRVSPAATGNGTGENISGLIAGTYNITVTSGGGCTGTSSVVINQPQGPGLTTKPKNTGASCRDGHIEIIITSGSGSYTYFWSDGVTTKNRIGLLPGTYMLTVTDTGNGCTSQTSATILLGSPVTTSVFSLNPSCFGSSTGAINITPDGGAGSYTYLWSGGITTEDRLNVPAGTYNLTITDLAGCSSQFSYELVNPPTMQITYTKNDPTCIRSGDINISISGGTQPYNYNWLDIIGNINVEDRIGITSGSYVVVVTDANGCTKSASVTLEEPDCETLAEVVCKSSLADKYNVNPNPDVTSYIWRVPDGAVISSGQGTSAITVNWSGASPGTGEICVYTTNSCGESGEICKTLYIQEVIATATITSPKCTNSEIKFTGGGGIFYTWSGPFGFSSNLQNPTIKNANSSHAGLYTVTVTNDNGCTASASVSLSFSAKPSLSIANSNASSCGTQNGSLDLTVTQGTGPYNYVWSNGAFTEDIINLNVGSYAVTVSDNNGCTNSAIASVNNAEGFSLSSSSTDVTCYNGSDGAASISVNGGSGSFLYQWSNGAGTLNISGVKAGTYRVTVTDIEESCFAIQTVIINQPSPLLTDIKATNVSQYGQNNGQIDLSVTGGSPVYAYNWSDLPGNSNPEDRVNLAGGMYAVTITDTKNCATQRLVEIAQPSGPLSATGVVGNISCYGLSNGYIDVTVTGGLPPYNYQWSSGQTTEDIKALLSGSYSVTVTDSKLVSSTATFVITQPNAVNPTINVTNNLCYNGMSGQLTLNVTGGTTPYTYVWSNAETSQSISQLTAGTYSVTVNDANLCSAVRSATVLQASDINIASSKFEVLCQGTNSGGINLTVTGGAGNFSYLWSNGNTNNNIAGIGAGIYTVTVTDVNLCTKTSTISLDDAKSIQISNFASQLSCNEIRNGAIDITVTGGTSPYSYVWSFGATSEDIDELPAGTYTITVTDANECTKTATISLSEPQGIVVNAIPVYPDCYGPNRSAIEISHIGGTGPFTYAWSTGENTQNIMALPDGIYFVTVTDSKGCTGTSISLITQPPKLVVTGVTVPNCPGQNNGSLTLYINGGTEPYNYAWSDGQNGLVRSGLGTGTYTVSVTDAKGCQNMSQFNLSPLSIQFFNVLPSCAIDQETSSLYVKENGEIYSKISGGTPPYRYTWSTGDTTAFITNLALGIYNLTVTGGGCTLSDQSYLTGNACIPPVAVDDFYLTEMNVPVEGNCAINDYDPNAEYPLTFLPLGYIDLDKGVLKWDTTYNGAFKFTPAPGYFGTFSVPYQVCDTLNLCAKANLTIRVEKPVIGVAKVITNLPVNNEDGSYDFTYTIFVENLSLLGLHNLQVVENLDSTFVGSTSYTIRGVRSTHFMLNSSFDGSSNRNLLTGTNTLAPLGTGYIYLDIRLVPGTKRGPYLNHAIVSAISPAGVTKIDYSQNGTLTDPDNDGDPTNNNEPTPLLFCPGANISGANQICIGSTTTMSPSSGGTWESLNPSVATINNAGIVTAVAAGTSTFVYRQNGCESEPSFPVTVIGQVGTVTGSTSLCLGNTTTLIPNTGGAWSSSNPSVATVNNSGIVTGVSFGSATFSFTDAATGCITLPTQAVTVSDKPLVTITGGSLICTGSTTTLSPSSGGTWTSSNTSVATVNNAGVVTGIAQGIATFTFTLNSGCISNPTAPITVNGRPTVLLVGDPEICIGATAQVLPSSGGTWTSSNPSVATITNGGIITGVASGTVNFTFTETSTGCFSPLIQTITVKNRPSSSLSGVSAICIGLTTTLSPSSGGVWTSSNNAIATVNNAGVVFGVNPGQATFTFRDDVSQCSSLPTLPVTINDKPIVSYSGPSTICAGTNTNLLPSSGGTWTSSNPAIAQITSSGLVTAVAPGSVTFTFVSSATGCISNPSAPLTILGKPSVSITGSTAICTGSTTALSPAIGGTWSSSNSAVATVNNSGIVTGVSPGTAIFYFTETGTGCISSATGTVTVNNNPTISLSGPSAICVGAATNVLPASGGTWASSNPTVATVSNTGVVTGISNGVVTLTYTAVNGCSSTSGIQVNVNGRPTISLNGPSSICLGTTTAFLPSSGGVWVSSNPSVATINNSGIVTGVSPGTTTFSFTDNLTGCSSSSTVPVTVNGKPSVSIIGPSTICEGANTNVSPTVNGSWTSTNPSVASVNNAGLVTGISAGSATFVFTQSSTGCLSDATAPITVNARPNIAITGNSPICVGSTTTLSPTSGGTWTSTNNSIASVTNGGIVTGLNAGNVRFTFTSSSTGCISQQSSLLVVQAKPIASVSGSSIICKGGTTTLFPSTAGTWISTNPSVASVNNNGLVTALSPGTSTFIYTDISTGCVSNATIPVTVSNGPEVMVSGAEDICVGFTTTLSPSTGGTWISNHPLVATVTSTGIVTAINSGIATFSFTGNSAECQTAITTDTLYISNCFEPDYNVTYVNIQVGGNVKTNDMVPAGTVYGSSPILLSKPLGATASITMNASGAYTFIANLPGHYTYNVPVCVSSLVQNCPHSLLKILVLEQDDPVRKPVANTDFGYTYANFNPSLPGYPVTMPTLANDRCIYSSGCNLDPLSVQITVPSPDGSAFIATNGDITFTPAPGFMGITRLTYKVCVENEPLNCDTAQQIIHVFDARLRMQNLTYAVDDFFNTYQETPVSGNVKLNDYDPEGDLQTVTPVGSALIPVQIAGGKYFITSNGDFTFTPDRGFTGPTSFVYQTCDNNIQPECATATVNIFVLKDLTVRLRVYLEGALYNNNNATSADSRPLMRDNLRMSPFTSQNFIPIQDPYKFPTEFVDVTSFYSHELSGLISRFHTIADPSAVFGVSGQNAIVDWVFVELRLKTDPTKIVATRSGLLQRDGDIVDIDGISPLAFPNIAPDNYYFVVRHRNHLGVMSNLMNTKDLIDFTTPQLSVFSFGTSKNNGYDYTGYSTKVVTPAGHRALWAGDFNGDGKLKFVNPSDDQNILFFDVLTHPNNLTSSANFNFAYGYLQGDYDLNGKAKYDNPDDDKNLLFSQIVLFPLNQSLLSNFNFFIQQIPPSAK